MSYVLQKEFYLFQYYKRIKWDININMILNLNKLYHFKNPKMYFAISSFIYPKLLARNSCIFSNFLYIIYVHVSFFFCWLYFLSFFISQFSIFYLFYLCFYPLLLFITHFVYLFFLFVIPSNHWCFLLYFSLLIHF